MNRRLVLIFISVWLTCFVKSQTPLYLTAQQIRQVGIKTISIESTEKYSGHSSKLVYHFDSLGVFKFLLCTWKGRTDTLVKINYAFPNAHEGPGDFFIYKTILKDGVAEHITISAKSVETGYEFEDHLKKYYPGYAWTDMEFWAGYDNYLFVSETLQKRKIKNQCKLTTKGFFPKPLYYDTNEKLLTFQNSLYPAAYYGKDFSRSRIIAINDIKAGESIQPVYIMDSCDATIQDKDYGAFALIYFELPPTVNDTVPGIGVPTLDTAMAAELMRSDSITLLAHKLEENGITLEVLDKNFEEVRPSPEQSYEEVLKELINKYSLFWKEVKISLLNGFIKGNPITLEGFCNLNSSNNYSLKIQPDGLILHDSCNDGYWNQDDIDFLEEQDFTSIKSSQFKINGLPWEEMLSPHLVKEKEFDWYDKYLLIECGIDEYLWFKLVN